MRRAFLVAAAAAAVGVASEAYGQLPDSIVAPRLDSASMCPQVFVRRDPEMHYWSIETSPITKRIAGRDLAMVIGAQVLPAGLGTTGMLQFMSMGDGAARYRAAHDIVIVADDSIRIPVATKYEDNSPSPNVHFETIPGQVHSYDLDRLLNAKRITVNLGKESHALSAGQVQAVRALVRAMSEPLSEREVATGCNGPSRAALEAKWEMMNSRLPRQGRVVFLKGDSIGVNASVKTYFEFQVEKPASSTGNAGPLYPAVLKGAKVEGTVLAQFVVLEDGRADMDTFKVLFSSQELFSESARDAVRRMRFNPAEIAGKKVRQLVQLPFEFKLSGSKKAQTDTAAQGPILLRMGGSSEIISVPRDLPKWTTIEISHSDSSHLPSDIYLPSQVDVPVRSPDGRPIPTEVPPELGAMFTGYAVLEFVANADGTVDNSTFKVLRATSQQVADIYSHGTHGMYVLPAELHGKKVKQLVVMATPVMIKPRQ